MLNNDSAQSSNRAAGRLEGISQLRPTLAIVLGSGFHHVLTELCADKIRNAGGNPHVCPARRGRGGHEHGAGGNGGAAMRIERGGGFLHHQPGGRAGGKGQSGEGFGSGIAEKCHEILWKN